MSRKSKTKITTEHNKTFPIESPFAAIHLDDLPEGSIPEPDTTATVDQKTKSRGRVEVTREKAGRAGKLVTVLSAFEKSVSSKELAAMACNLKKHCACGGSLKGRAIELQGDVCKPVMVELAKQNFKPVRCGY